MLVSVEVLGPGNPVQQDVVADNDPSYLGLLG